MQEEIFGSAYASAVYIGQILNLPKDKKVFVIGESGLEDELRSEGLTVCGGSVRSVAISLGRACADRGNFCCHLQDPKSNEPLPSQDFAGIKADPDVGAVLCGCVLFDAGTMKGLADAGQPLDLTPTSTTASSRRHTCASCTTMAAISS